MFVLEEIVKKIPVRSMLSRLSSAQKLQMYEMKINGETNETICQWLKDTCDVHISPRSLFRIFKDTIPEILLQNNKIVMFEPHEMDTKHIEKLEKVAELQFQRIKTQFFDESERAGDAQINNETGEIDYSGTNKHLNETISTYNRLVKTIYELKMSIGLIRRAPEEKKVTHGFNLNSAQRDAMKRMVISGLQNTGRLDKFKQSISSNQVTDADYEEPALLIGSTEDEEPPVIDLNSEDVKSKV